ncbi:MFS general substrate transporter [Coniochaeta ligniaria NRRL 30616]|uniref:MFS general substrate transporter n=1 Tax=Coniochaeta ligniaria NRRL 30616 TaxID=1408157 RepID=A0A1J7IX23_9PEZI|nr:MFS general substrate transporter [Coniochaeta ligniaria NRRL 30616]
MNMDMDRKPLPPPPAPTAALPLQHLSFDHPSFDHSSFDLFDHRITLNVHKHDYEVDWDGPNDPANPKNWKSSSRMLQVLPIAFFALNMNLAATMFAPGVDELVAEFGITNSTIATMTLSIYVLGFAMGVVIAPLSELYGRLWLYHASNTVWLAFTLGCAFATNTASFMVFRFLAGCAGSVPMTTGAGSVADIIPPKDRGKFMAIWGLGPLIGPVVGPIVGGFMTQAVGWRWTFRLLAILGGISLVGGIIVLRETHEATLLKRKVAQLRLQTADQTYIVTSRVDKTRNISPLKFIGRALIRPTKILLFSPIVLCVSLYNAVVFGLMFLLFDTFPQVFAQAYSFSPGLQGLAYLGFGFGTLLSMAITTKYSDRLMRAATDTKARPELRLKLMMYFSPAIPVGFFWYGWAAETRTHWIVPILGTFVIGFGSLFVMLTTHIYLVDVFDAQAAASALSAALITRILFGTFLPFCAAPLYGRLGLGWGNSLLGFLVLALSPVPFVFYRYGSVLRERFPVYF